MKANWSVAVVYEDAGAREEAVGFCDHLVKKFWSECEFDVGWWSFAHLEKKEMAEAAGLKASEADMIVFATRPEGTLPLEVEAWVEGWLRQRGEREGALVGLLAPGAEATEKHAYLRTAAHRGGMDYLTEMPENLWHLMPESPESLDERVGRVTSVLDEILHHHSPPPQLFV